MRKQTQLHIFMLRNKSSSINQQVCDLHQEQVWRGGHVLTEWHLPHGGCCGTLRFHGNGPPGSSHKWQRCRLGYEMSSTALAPEQWRREEPQLHKRENPLYTGRHTHVRWQGFRHTVCSYLEDGIHDAAEGSVVGEFCYSEYVKTPLV